MHIKSFSLLVSLTFGTVAAIAAFSLAITTDRLNDSSASIGTAVHSVYFAEELRGLLRKSAQERLVGDVDAPDRRETLNTAKSTLFEQVDQYATTRAEHDLVRLVKRNVEEYFKQLDSARDDDALKAYRELSPFLARATSSIDQLIELNRSQAEESASQASVDNFRANGVAVLLVLIVLLAILAVVALTKRILVAPTMMIHKAVKEYRHGATIANPCQETPIVELQQIGSAFEEMAATISRSRDIQLRFIAGVAHDIRNPLNALHTALHLLSDRSLPDGNREELLEVASKQVAHLTSLAKDLADTASIESGHVTLRRKLCDLSTLVRDAASFHQTSAPMHQLLAKVPAQCIFHGDPERLTQVLNNLIGNAIKFSPKGGTITITITSDGSAVLLTVTDTGIGISSNELPGLFEPFKRTPASRGEFEGLGLGLSVVKHIVEAHGGSIRVESALGQGSSFHVMLPKDPVE